MGTSSEKEVPISLPIGESVGAFSCLTIDVGEVQPIMNSAAPGQVGMHCIRKELSKPRKMNKQHFFMASALSSCPDFLHGRL